MVNAGVDLPDAHGPDDIRLRCITLLLELLGDGLEALHEANAELVLSRSAVCSGIGDDRQTDADAQGAVGLIAAAASHRGRSHDSGCPLTACYC